MTRNEKQMRAYRAELALGRVLRDLGLELVRGTERKHLEPRVELALLYVDDLGPTTLGAVYRAKLSELVREVEAVPRAALRVVK